VRYIPYSLAESIDEARVLPEEQTEAVLSCVCAWAKTQDSIRAVALVGSWARGTASSASDIDLVLLAINPQTLRSNTGWIDDIDWRPTGLKPLTWRDDEYGPLWSRHVRTNQVEIEFGFAPLSWADCAPVDTGTNGVVSGGCRILYDPDERLAALTACVLTST
jgi:hypothetical protein